MVAALSGPVCWSASLLDDQYDAAIQQAVKRWWPGVDWRLWKAQLWQESRFDPDAVSPVGARGLAQFMPATWAEVSQQMKINRLSPHLAEPAIEAGAFYMARLRQNWSSPRPEQDRHSLALASYNAGLGNLLKAQRACDGALLYANIAQCLPQITGAHAQETLYYVPAVWRWYRNLLIIK